MSVVETPQCAHCDGPRDPAESASGSFCSPRCARRHRGARALAQLQSDARFCSTCWGQVRQVEHLPEEAPNVAAPLRWGTHLATDAIDEARRIGDSRQMHTRLGCHCGAVDPSDDHAMIRKIDLEGTIVRLYRALEHLGRDGAIGGEPHWPAMRETLREHGTDWPLAAGAALEGAP